MNAGSVGRKRRPKVLHIITRLDRGGSAENVLLTVLGLKEEFAIEYGRGGKKVGVSAILAGNHD